MGRYTSGSVGRDILAGAAAGAAAIWVKNRLDQAIARSASQDVVRRTQAARPGGMDPEHALAKKAADAVGLSVANPKDNPAGHTIDYGMAAGLGALYGLLRGMSPTFAAGRGIAYGLTVFLLKDEIGNAYFGTAGNPLDYPLQDHARRAASHSVFGLVTDLGTRLISPWRDVVVIEEGPSLSERVESGRAYLGQARDQVYEQGRRGMERGRVYLDQGSAYAGEVARQARARLSDVDVQGAVRQGRAYAGQVAGSVRSRMPDPDDVTAYARTGLSRTRSLASDASSRLGDFGADVARTGRRHAAELEREARRNVQEPLWSGLSRIVQRLFG